MKRMILSLVCFCLILFPLGCKSSGNNSFGSISISIANEVATGDLPSAQTATPNTEMWCLYYNITGSGPYGKTFSKETYARYCQIDNLIEGNWRITVDGYNAENTRIVTGAEDVAIFKNTTNVVTITVKPVSGQGTLSINISWPEGFIADPSVNAALTSSGQIVTDVSDQFIINSNTAALNMTLKDGYYQMNIELYDSSAKVWGEARVVRILSDQTTNVLYPLTTMDFADDTILIADITNDYQNPIKVLFSGIKTSLDLNEDMTVSVHFGYFEDYVEIDSYQWFLNGRLLEGENDRELTIGSNLPPGYYRLDCIVKMGAMYSGNGFEFSILPSIKKIEKIEKEVSISDMIWYENDYWGYSGNRIYKLNPQMDVLEEITIQAIDQYTQGTGFVWDGENFWISTRFDKIYKLNTNFEVIGEYEPPLPYPEDVAWDGNYLWLGSSNGNLVKCNVHEDHLEIIESYTLAHSIGEMIWINDRLWIIDRSISPDIFLYSSSMTRLHWYKLYDLLPDKREQHSVSGFCWDGKNFWTFSGSAYKIYGLEVD